MIDLRPELERILPPERILDRPIDVAAYASDASFYGSCRARPAAGIDRRGARAFSPARAAAGADDLPRRRTSLSGQAISDRCW